MTAKLSLNFYLLLHLAFNTIPDEIAPLIKHQCFLMVLTRDQPRFLPLLDLLCNSSPPLGVKRSSHQKKKTASQVAAENVEKGIPVQENNKKARYNKIFKDQNWPKVITSIEEKYILLIKLFASEIVRQCNIGSKFLLKSRPRVQS